MIKDKTMKVKIRTKDFRFFLPVPASLIGFAVKLIPDKACEKMRASTPAPYCCLITKENIRRTAKECLDVLKEHKGLEIIHVEAEDGTFVSVKL